jgi:hypothetical protein
LRALARLGLVGMGVAVGLGGAAVLTRLMESLLWHADASPDFSPLAPRPQRES